MGTRTDVYHAGSRAVQDRVGARGTADHVGRSVGQVIKPVAAAFLRAQPLLVAGAADPATGRVWASPLTGPPGFARAAGERRMEVTGRPHPDDPLAAALATGGTAVGTIVLDPRTRRRMRLNGRLHPTPRGFAVEADRVFANCPKYLRRRDSYETAAAPGPGASRRGRALTDEQRAFAEAADTFFIATVHADGADASHRGGDPGFLRAPSPTELTWRDYPGNAMFLTLGNLAADPRAGLLLLDWTTGRALRLTGTARTEFTPGGERRVRFTVTTAVDTPRAVPLRWSAPAHSPVDPPLPG